MIGKKFAMSKRFDGTIQVKIYLRIKFEQKLKMETNIFTIISKKINGLNLKPGQIITIHLKLFIYRAPTSNLAMIMTKVVVNGSQT